MRLGTTQKALRISRASAWCSRSVPMLATFTGLPLIASGVLAPGAVTGDRGGHDGVTRSTWIGMQRGSLMEKLLYTASETGAKLSMSRSMVYVLMASGQLESVQIGKSRRVPAGAIESFVARLQEVAGADMG